MSILQLTIRVSGFIKNKAIKHKHPIGAFLTWTCGDMLTQKLEQRINQNENKLDLFRSICSGFYGMLFVTPIATRWYGIQFNGGINILPNNIQQKVQSQSTFKKSLIQTGLTFVVCAPFFAISYITWMGFTYKDNNKSVIKSEAKKTFVPIVLSDLCFWPCADMINFAVVPQQYRFWAMLLEDMVWASILSIWGNDHEKIDHLHEVVGNDELKISSVLIDAFRSSEDVFITAAFHILDKDKSSTIELNEIQEFMKQMNIEEETKNTILSNAFPNNADTLEIDDFKRYLKSEEGKILKSLIQFHVIDIDKNGQLSHDEAVAMYGKKYADDLWKNLRAFNDEEIDVKAYLSQMNNNHSKAIQQYT